MSREQFLVEFHRTRGGITSRAMARGASYDRLVAVIGRARRVLDLGCGDGFLVEKLGARAIGIDLAAGECEAASRRDVAIVRGRAEALPFADGSFDAIASHLAFMLMDARAVALEIDRVLAPGGTFAAIVGGGPSATGDDAFHRYLALARPIDLALVDPAAKSEAGWRGLFPGFAIAFERIALDLSGTLDDVWAVLGASYGNTVERDALAAACADFDPSTIPLTMVVWLATARRR